MRLLKILFVLLLVLVPASYALTASIGNAKMILRPEVLPGEETVIERSIKVNNVNDVPVDIELEAQGDLINIVEILDKSFTLQPGETKHANFIITLQYGGHYEGKIAVKFTPSEGGQGVGLSSSIIILAEGPENPNPDIEPVDDDVNDTDDGIGDDDTGDDDTTDTGDDDTGGINVGGGGPPPDIPTGAATLSTKTIFPIIVGLMVVLTIIFVGLAAYILFTMLKK